MSDVTSQAGARLKVGPVFLVFLTLPVSARTAIMPCRCSAAVY